MHRILTLGVLIAFFIAMAYITGRSAAESSLAPLRMKPTPTPTKNPYYIPNLGKALSNQSVQIWAMQTEIKTLQSQMKSQQSTIARLQGQVYTLSSQLGSLSSQWSGYKFKLDYWFSNGLPAGAVSWGDLKSKGMSTSQYDNILLPGMYKH